MAIFSMFPLFLTFGNIATLLSGNYQLNNQFKIKAIASNKKYDVNGHFKQQLRFKRQDNSLYNARKQNPGESFITNKLKNGEVEDGVKPISTVLEVRDDLRDEPTFLGNLQMNSQIKGTLVYNWKRDVHCQHRSKFIHPIRGEKQKYKRERGAVTKDQNYAINNIHNMKRTRLLSNREKVRTMKKLLKGAIYVNTIQSKRVEMEPQEPIESSWNTLKQSSRLDNINETLYPITGLNVWNQLPIETSNDLSSSYNSGPISKQHYQRDFDIGQDSQPNGQIDNANNYLTLNYFSNSSKGTTTKETKREKVNVINLVDTFQTPDLRAIKYKLHAQTVIQTDYLPSFNDLDHSNNNISIRSMYYPPSETLNQTVIQPKKKVSTKKIFKSKKKKNTRYHTKVELSKVFVTQSERLSKHRKIQQTEVNVKQSRGTKKYMNGLSTKTKRKSTNASKKWTSHLWKKVNSMKTVRVIKSSEHRINIKKVALYADDHRAGSKHLKKMKWYKTSSKKKKFYPVTSSKKNKQSMNKKYSKAGGRNDKQVNRKTATGYFVRMGVSESDVVKPLKLIDRDAEVKERAHYYYSNVGGIFNSYYNFWNNNNNHYIYISSGMTDKNAMNNLIIIDFDTSPTSSTKKAPTLSSGGTTHTHGTIMCKHVPSPTVYFIKKKGVKDYTIVIAAFASMALAVIISCCCCCAPVIILRRRNKECSPS